MNNLSTGKAGEELARKHLISLGYTILDMNVTSRWGEIDIIAQKEATLYFCEVKTSNGTKYGKPYERVSHAKITSLQRAIDYYLKLNDLYSTKYTILIISIVLEPKKATSITMYDLKD